MYKPNLIRLFALAIPLIMQSCSKDDAPAPNPPVAEHQLAKIEWSNNSQKETYEYNTDNTLKRIVYTTGQVSNSYEFTWNANKVTEMYDLNSPDKNLYSYNAGRVSHITNVLKNDPTKISYKMEYTYRQDGKVDKLKYFIINNAGTELKAGTTYNYNAAGELSSTVTFMDEYTITHTIENYSSPVTFSPWGFIDLNLLEDFMIYNYPVLSTMKGFPKKITRSVKINDNPEFVDTITTNTCEISNNRINKITIDFKVPGAPSLDRTRTATLTYK